jgi:dipeptidyl aminopeptidase/acylaminoacyl peptidase
MSVSSLSALRRIFLFSLALLAAPLAAAAQPVPLSAFFDNPSVGGAKLSPDGRRLAMVVNSDNGHDRLGVVNLADNSLKVVASFRDADVGDFEWISATRLVYDSHDKNTALADQRYAPGLFAVNADGSQRRQLVHVVGREFISEFTFGREKLPWNTYMLGQPGAQDSDSVYVQTIEWGHDYSPTLVELVKLNTLTGTTETVARPGNTQRWWLDAKGQPALATTVDGNVEALHYLDPKDKRWRKIASGDLYLGAKGGFEPVGFTPQGVLYVVSRQDRDKSALFTYDLATGKVAREPLVDLQEFDFHGELVTNAAKLLGVRYTADAEATAWFDPAMKAHQAAVDKLLPNRVNSLSVAVRSETPFVLVESYSDRQPRSYFLFNSDSGQLSRIGDSRPAVNASRMAGMDLVKVKARDGRQVPAWLTLPSDRPAKKLPMVVLVHGGPYVRGHQWEWEAESQFLASRGYLVLQPEFRGSTGYGADHFRAGWKQWGLAMQDDIADAARWAIAEGLADPERVCIAGASYGGYATLMGLIRDPDLYKCGINWVGVTDIALLFTGHWSRDSDTSESYKRYGMPAMVGDPVKDAAQFAATSPLKQAARVTRPLLLAYGGADLRVPVYHGRKFYDAVKATNKDVEWVLYEDEGHSWTLVETRLDFWSRVEKFLGRHIGPKP